jgi:hypothetical protein
LSTGQAKQTRQSAADHNEHDVAASSKLTASHYYFTKVPESRCVVLTQFLDEPSRFIYSLDYFLKPVALNFAKLGSLGLQSAPLAQEVLLRHYTIR